MRSGVAIAEGGEEFTTLPAEDVLLRGQFASALRAGSDDPAMLAVLAGVDLRLGLVSEACEEFGEAFKQKPGDEVLRRALDSACSKVGREAK